MYFESDVPFFNLLMMNLTVVRKLYYTFGICKTQFILFFPVNSNIYIITCLILIFITDLIYIYKYMCFITATSKIFYLPKLAICCFKVYQFFLLWRSFSAVAHRVCLLLVLIYLRTVELFALWKNRIVYLLTFLVLIVYIL